MKNLRFLIDDIRAKIFFICRLTRVKLLHHPSQAFQMQPPHLVIPNLQIRYPERGESPTAGWVCSCHSTAGSPKNRLPQDPENNEPRNNRADCRQTRTGCG